MQMITTDEILFAWLWSHLNNLEPRVAISGHIISEMDDFFDDLIDEGYIRFTPVYWPDIFWSVCSTEQADPTARRCGAKLLEFVGELSAAIEKNKGARIPRQRTIEMMLEYCRDLDKYLKWHSSSTRLWVETTPLGVETLGVSLCVDMLLHNEEWLGDNLFDLSVPFE
jgi:hypothetical protein